VKTLQSLKYLVTVALVVALVPKYNNVPATVEGVNTAAITDDVGTTELNGITSRHTTSKNKINGTPQRK
jgi:hypothetical protein